MALTSAVANAAAAAAAAGAGKKAAQVQLQAELNTDDEWNKFINRDGLLVIDVYTEWCGPCIGMVGNLKKIKVELGGDNLHLAIAKSDTIECLKRFRKRSEPTWMFIAAGQLLNVVFGADAPRLARTIEQELQNEELARKGERERPKRAPHELTPPEQEVAEAKEKLQQERRAREEAAVEAARIMRRETRACRLETHFADVCPALVMPHAQKHLRKITDALEPHGVILADKCPILLGKDGVRVLGVEELELATEAAISAIAERPSLALLLKKTPEKDGDVIELCRRALYGDGVKTGDGEPNKKVPAEELRAESTPGVYVPADRHQRAAVLDLLFPKQMVSSLVEPGPPPTAPHIALMFGAWQRRALLAVCDTSRLLHYGFFADASLTEPKLLAKNIEQYELRPEKDFSETIVLMIAVGLAAPELADPKDIPPQGPPEQLLALGPLHVSEDAVVGAEECAKFFPPGYSEPEPKPKQKPKKKKKTKRHETKEDLTEESNAQSQSIETGEPGESEAAVEGDNDGDAEVEGDVEGEGEVEEDGEDGEEQQAVDKATSPPPPAPH
ncbi:thioredoxin domain-containing protein 6-like isoform X3 [Bombyx mandarina]|uniref:Thioredoxin domain-containing protein 6-like isoform X3 n=1 Tax=Bombyx mandarina TaxID=7092 RepID=A0A6J2KD49_BOMMA|nr:thioredoxin domain-containing protein 6-like isoform X3 [Bombyx mandarina]